MRLTLIIMLSSAVFIGTGCSGSKGAATRPLKAAQPGQHDRLWASRAYQYNLFQLEAARLAAGRSTTDRVRNLARMMLTDFTELGGQIETLARQHHLLLPSETDEAHADELQQLAAVPAGPDFDRSYLNLTLKSHHQLLDLYEDEANNGEYPGARAVAQDNLAGLYAHERYIEQLRPGTWTSPAKPTGDEANRKEQPTTRK